MRKLGSILPKSDTHSVGDRSMSDFAVDCDSDGSATVAVYVELLLERREMSASVHSWAIFTYLFI